MERVFYTDEGFVDFDDVLPLLLLLQLIILPNLVPLPILLYNHCRFPKRPLLLYIFPVYPPDPLLKL